MDFKPGDIIRHFKYNTLTEKEKKQCKHVYVIMSVNAHIQSSSGILAETDERGNQIEVCIYKQVAAPYMIFVRPIKEMYDVVNKNGQVHRFEIVKEENNYVANEHDTRGNNN